MLDNNYLTRNFATFKLSEYSCCLSAFNINAKTMKFTVMILSKCQTLYFVLYFAKFCVFVKQSLLSSLLFFFRKDFFKPKLQKQFAEFLNLNLPNVFKINLCGFKYGFYFLFFFYKINKKNSSLNFFKLKVRDRIFLQCLSECKSPLIFTFMILT